MTGEQLTLDGASPRRRRGIARSQLDRTLIAWRRADQLAGDEYAAARAALRDAAEAVDYARTAMRDGTGSPYTVAMTVRTFADLLAALGPREGGVDAELAALVAGLGTPTRVPDPTDT